MENPVTFDEAIQCIRACEQAIHLWIDEGLDSKNQTLRKERLVLLAGRQGQCRNILSRVEHEAGKAV